MIKTAHGTLILAAALLTSGCVSSIVTAPFKAAGTVIETAVDATTQTQQEADEDRGKRLRMAEKNEEKLRKKCAKDPEHESCDTLAELERERALIKRRDD
ncbi:hypothetical protein [Sphingorhabdus sp. Alg239-R122]|uniref:hypothetical protein n=1 Tax=Sphingorhabdus sp. Alg239-R122 TaxID=2305989 RepID=UPI00196899B2|nr:hypothetical protein [Sphingorhabdus sp. Alg239-R122]